MGLFETKRNLRGMDGSGRLSEQEDINSDFMPQSEYSLMSGGDIDGIYFSSHSGRKDDPIFDKTSDSDSDSNINSDSVEYYSSSDEDDSQYNDHAAEKDDASDTSPNSPTSDSEMIGDSRSGDAKTQKKEKKSSSIRRTFLGRLFSGKRKGKKDVSKSNKKSGWGASEMSDELSIEHPEESKPLSQPQYDRSAKSYLQNRLDVSAESYDISIVDDGSQSQSTSVKYVGDVTDDGSRSQSQSQANYSVDEGSSSQMSDDNQILSKKKIQEKRRKSYERKLPGVVEERSEEEGSKADEYESYHRAAREEHNSYKYALPEEPKAAIPNSRMGVPPHHIRPDAPEEIPDPPEKKSKKTKSKHSQHSRSSREQRKAQTQAHASALAARNHAASSRIDCAGQISSSALTLKDKLNNEIHQLRTLVDLMMMRMELYERQSECLVEASVEHNREWKVAKIKNLKSVRRTKESPTEEQLSNIKSLLIKRTVQDKWIRKLEEIQRGYQGRLVTTQDQLRTLRYEHIITSKQIIDLKKGKGSLADCGTTEYTPETSTDEGTKNSSPNEVPPTLIVNNIPLHRWKGEPGGDRSGDPKDRDSTETKTVSTMDLEGRKMISLLDEMIVSWHTAGTDMSPLSEKGVPKKKKKKDKKKKKKKKKDRTSVSTVGGKT
jgi:hypothetical protein